MLAIIALQLTRIEKKINLCYNNFFIYLFQQTKISNVQLEMNKKNNAFKKSNY